MGPDYVVLHSTMWLYIATPEKSRITDVAKDQKIETPSLMHLLGFFWIFGTGNSTVLIRPTLHAL